MVLPKDQTVNGLAGIAVLRVESNVSGREGSIAVAALKKGGFKGQEVGR